MAPKAAPQTAMDEKVIESDDLEKALEGRERAKAGASEANAAYKTKDEVVKGMVEDLGLDEDETVRCGRFRISKSAVAPKNVAFETGASTRLTISPDPEE